MSNGMATKAPESLALQITKENNMASRTAEGKHTTRFIVLTKGYAGLAWTRSISMPGFYATKEEAQNAISGKQNWFPGVQFKVRQK